MRQIDFWAGVPLAFLMTLYWRIRCFFSPPAPSSAKNILFIELSEMGSAVIADAALKRAGALFPEAKVYFLIFAKNRPSLDIMGTIARENMLTIRADSLFTLAIDTIRMIGKMRSLDLMAAIDLEMFSRFSALLTFLSGAPKRVGFHRFHTEGLYRGELLTHRVPYNPHQHVAKCFMALVHALTEPEGTTPHGKVLVTDEEIRLAPVIPTPDVLEAFKARLFEAYPVLRRVDRWVIFNPNASELMPLRRWPYDRYMEVARRLLAEDESLAVIITGVASEKAEAQTLVEATGSDRAVNLAGFTRMEDLIPLYALSKAMVTNDSGPAHFAAPVGLPTLVLFGPETPALYGALNDKAEFLTARLACSPCVSAMNHRSTACTDPACMRAITVEQVHATMRRLLG
ncbi:ADP-heptose--lipooligosaccharide heptosyltransferase II [Paramagnetospirillum magnetotacticum MS-1]|uniref:ADP-heptose--lipooligosaccharide heptosyltransferase II n=2 Tax=Paramagnetospirillum magnetotacticum TaxID=188 RepID=A0A0C2U7D0_PARME|nr:ADP-heptose--lipooligosaccharide heptosyltransferase II [Paramagnetospirillum magnetotacticum MS-1]